MSCNFQYAVRKDKGDGFVWKISKWGSFFG